MKLALRVLIHCAACVIFLGGKLLFDWFYDFHSEEAAWQYWLGNNTYYIWDKLSFLLLVLCIIYPCKKMKNLFYPMVAIMVFRLIQEIPIVRDWQEFDTAHGMFYVDAACFIWFLIIVGIEAYKSIIRVQKELKSGIPPTKENDKTTSAFFV